MPCVGIKTENLADSQTTQLGDLLGAAQSDQTVHRRLHQIDRVLRADALGQHVAHAAELEHGAHAASGDYSGTGTGRAQHDVAGAVATDDAGG